MNKQLPPMLLCDFYKQAHIHMYDSDTEKIYSTWTARASKKDGIDEIVVFGVQGFVKKYLIDYFNNNFFNKPLNTVIDEYVRVIRHTLNIEYPNYEHIVHLHNLRFLPLLIEAIPEGTRVPIRVPCVTIQNTDPKFFWLTNFIETLFSCEVWLPTTSATIAYQYKKILDNWADKTCDNNEHVKFQGHDFSMRGMGCLEASCTSGAGHLTSFVGTDTIPAIIYLENYYNANIEKELVGCSIPATEHSVMCCNGRDEYSSIKRLITKVYPNGFVSIVSDTWNLWDVLTKTLPALKDEIIQRDGRVVIRPDSGNPVDIICGLPLENCCYGSFSDVNDLYDPLNDNKPYFEERKKGVIELLWETFGGTTNSKGYKVLDSHIGCIYGDAITLERAEEICKKLEQKGFASSNIVFGIGSYTYQFNTRDTFGFALKSTYAIKDGKEVFLYKDPITDDGVKKSQKGMVFVWKNKDGKIILVDKLYQDNYDDLITFNGDEALLKPIFKNGELLINYSLNEIRDRIEK